MADWMVSYVPPDQILNPKVLFIDGQFIFTEKDARRHIKEQKEKHPDVEFRLSKNGKIVKENDG